MSKREGTPTIYFGQPTQKKPKVQGQLAPEVGNPAMELGVADSQEIDPIGGPSGIRSGSSHMIPGSSGIYTGPPFTHPGPSGLYPGSSSINAGPSCVNPRPLDVYPGPSGEYSVSVPFHRINPGSLVINQDVALVQSYPRAHRSRAEDRNMALPPLVPDVSQLGSCANVAVQSGQPLGPSDSIESMDVDGPNIKKVESLSSIEQEKKSKHFN